MTASVDRPLEDSRIPLTVVVTTYERPDYLRESLTTLVNQSALPEFRVVVLDNASNAGYSRVIAEFADRVDLSYFRSAANSGAEGNISRALAEFRDTKYLTVFHDDDLMHPQALEWQMRMLDTRPGLQFVATQFASFVDGTPPPFALWDIAAPCRSEVYPDAAGLVRSILSGSEPCFSSVMYRVDVLDKVAPDFDRFGMYFDRPYLVDIAKLGETALIMAPLVLYRLHHAQDSGSGAQSFAILIELMKAYRSELDMSGSHDDRMLFRRRSNAFMIGAYGMLAPDKRPLPPVFVGRGRAEGVLWLPGLSLLQWARILRAGLRHRVSLWARA